MCVCVVAPASLARHFDDVDLRYFYFSQSSFASLNLAQPPDTVDISHYTGLQHCCLNLPHASLATKRAGKFPTGFRAHSLSHVSISSIRRRESGIDRRHHQSREPPPPPESAFCHTQRTPSPAGSHQMTLRSWVPGRTNSFPNKSVQFSAQQCNPPSLERGISRLVPLKNDIN